MPTPPLLPVRWDGRRFHELDVDTLYDLLRLRSQVFVVEQHCPYLDLDGKDRLAGTIHLLGWIEDDAGESPATGTIAAALRILAPGVSYPQPSLGRIVTAPAFRGRGLGHVLVREGLHWIERLWPGADVQIGAQAHLQAYYAAHGFVACSAPYDEDGIPHVDMLRRARPVFPGSPESA